MTGYGRHYINIEFRFVYLEHVELCFETPIHDISCHLSIKIGKDQKSDQ